MSARGGKEDGPGDAARNVEVEEVGTAAGVAEEDWEEVSLARLLRAFLITAAPIDTMLLLLVGRPLEVVEAEEGEEEVEEEED